MNFRKRILTAMGVLALAVPAALAGPVTASASHTLDNATQSLGAVDLGSNVVIFDPTMPVAEIQAKVDAIHAEQVDNEMGTQRYSLLFMPGTYGSAAEPLVFEVGYYTEVAGLGLSPNDVVINGHVEVHNRCLAADNCIALVNFWRSLSNLTINVTGSEGCYASANFWAVSQASPMRRVNITGGNLSLMDYCTAGPQYASGGFIADSQTGFVINGSQQQFLVRNSTIGGWSNAVWNQVFSGVNGAPAQSFPTPQYTTLATTPVSQERPYLYVDADGEFAVWVPDPATNSSGTTWANGQTPGHSLAISEFYIAKPGDSITAINKALSKGKNLLLTPGVYDVASSIEVKRANTVVLGLGVATLTAVNGAIPLTVDDVAGVEIAGIMIDAGAQNSPVLLRLGKSNGNNHNSSAANPTVLHDVFFRIGGPHVGRASLSLEVNSDDVILDNIWVWRADHGEGVGWTVNTADTGVVINGDDVVATGLFVEHFQKYNLIWNGERGTVIFFQNELPYDAPNQAAWQHDGSLGWAAYKVDDAVTTHELWGGGVYIYTNVDPSLHASRGFEVPVSPGVKLHDLVTVNLGAGTIDHVVNDTGALVNSDAVGVGSYIVEFSG